VRSWLTIPLVLGGCDTTLEPVRLGRAACSNVEVLGQKYEICETPLEHAAAEQDCRLHHAQLAALDSAEKDDAVAKEVFALVSSSNVWLGGTRDEDLVWSWSNGNVFWRGGRDGATEPAAFARWQAGEPNNSNSQTGEAEACLALTAEGADWNDRSCALRLPYVCELD